ncbi:WxcM-like domain-containing protein [Sphingobacterium hungaricum]|uniref:dTDP-6-deoxy-3,4-keto-hexulose isomerase n=1 Tax=Sphingobacterium hungaricum TaxID=2082723 RepID=A0A928YQE0_9SPHI|nr:WxcM-like domain-containing protein [Sphingobacterium hungaricum]MBE8714116.1 dTDP-6-deoxy-3,4-keto-hexulose isomerase [Sphingobacterium hungaricum]
MIEFIQGGVYEDDRGQIRFVNDFDMTRIKRFYIIKNKDTELIRGWRAHRIEKRWFYVVSGSFTVQFVKIDSWEAPSRELEVKKEQLDATHNKVLYIPDGYGTAFKALEPESELIVFADFGIDHAKSDDYTFPLDYFVNSNDQEFDKPS